MEIWKDVVGYEGSYMVSNLGRIRGMYGKILRPVARRHGYLSVFLYGKGNNDRNYKQFSIHRLVAEAFIENPNGYAEVNHLDEDKTNNRSENLEWCDHKYNMNYGTVQKRRSQKIKNGPKARPIDQLDMDGNYIKTFPSMAEAKRLCGFEQSNIFYAISGRYKQAYGFKWRYSTDHSGRESAL